MGNKVLIKGDTKTSAIIEQFIRFLHYCGLPLTDVDFINADAKSMETLIKITDFKMLQFTGSSKVANHLAELTKGKIKIEDAGFNWKIIGPDVQNFDYVSWVSDQDAYSLSGQKCSAQSILAAHDNWIKAGLIDKLKELASRRSLNDLTISPVMTWTNERIEEHIKKVY